MDVDKLSKVYHYLKVRESVAVYYMLKTFKVDFYRSNLPGAIFSDNIVVTPNKFYMPIEMKKTLNLTTSTMEDFLVKMLNDSTAEFTQEMSFTDAFDQDKYFRDVVSRKADSSGYSKLYSLCEVVNLKPTNYFMMLLSTNRKKKVFSSRFYPRFSETNIYMDLLENSTKIRFPMRNYQNMEELQSMMTDTQEEYDLLMNLANNIYQKRTFKKGENVADLKSDYKTLLTENFKEKLTYSRFKYWERSRHEIFSQVCLTLINVKNIENTDVNLQLKYNYYGQDHNKTPDYIDEENNIILDFSVTTSNAGFIRDKKIKKYYSLATGFSEFMNETYKSDAIVWKITNRSEFQIPREYQYIRNSLASSEILDFIFEMQRAVKLDPSYEKFKAMSDKEDEILETDSESNLEIFNSLINISAKNKLNGKRMKAVDVADSRKDMRGKKKDKVYFMDTSIVQDLEETSKLDVDEYKKKVKSAMVSFISKESYPDSFSNMFSNSYSGINASMWKMMKNEANKRKAAESRTDFKIPKLFKAPFWLNNEDNMPFYLRGNSMALAGEFDYTDDGTVYYHGDFDFQDEKKSEEHIESEFYNTEGVGINYKFDKMMMEDLAEYMCKTADMKFYNPISPNTFEPEIQDFMKTNAWAMITSMSDLFENLCYMEGRRHILNSSSGHTVSKNFGNYYLMVKKGSKLTSQKQIRYRLIIPKKNLMLTNSKIIHSFIEMEEDRNMVWTKWLSASITDIRHFAKMKEVTISLLSSILDKDKENSKNLNKTMNLRTKINMMYLIILMENKRDTSTSLQLNRYLVHSITSYVSNRKKLAKEIFEGPVRSYGAAYVRITQFDWFMKMLPQAENMTNDRILNMTNTSNDYDRFHLPSFFDLDTLIEFSRVMDEMYLCNLFDKEAGFNSHRNKQIVNKQEVMENHFDKIKNTEESRGNIEDVENFLNKDDEFHTFDKKYVVISTKRFFQDKVNKVKLKEAEMMSINAVVNSAMMMTSSLKSGPYESEALEFTNRIVKSRSFLTLFEEVDMLSTNVLLEMCQSMTHVDAIFAIFPKAQIGGPREILIQSIKLRIVVKFLETYSKNLCKIHEKEMLTKTHQKAETQSDTLADMREAMRSSVKKGNNSLFFSMNADASKWSPSFVMENFMHFVYNWDINKDMKELLLTVISSFSSKKMLVPDDLKRKWENKDKNLTEYNEGTESFRQQAYENNYVVELTSGMGQGMFHFLSSLYHCVTDDMNEEIIKEVMMERFHTSMYQKVMKSSDDSTTIGMMMYGKNLSVINSSIKAYVFMYDSLNRLSNIHTNWKKSGLNFIISEFNSLFSIGKRMVWATIKDIYTSNSIPDLTSPEEAVVFMNSNIRRAFEHGVYLTTINVMMKLASMQLKRYYKYDDNLISLLKYRFNCEEDLLPYQLGFFPSNMPVETMLFGLEVNMFNTKNSDELKKFYYNLYTAEKTFPSSKMKRTVPFSEESTGKYWFELPSRLDKTLLEMKETFFKDMLKMDSNEINSEMEKNALNFNLSISDMKAYNQFTMEYFVGMNRKYEFQETMVVHSLVRALQLSKTKGMIFPKMLSETSDEYMLNELNNKFNNPYITKEERSDVVKEMKMLELKIDTYKCDVFGFVSYIMSKQMTNKSGLLLMKNYEKIALNFSAVEDSLKTMNKTSRYYHATMKTLRFYAGDSMLNVSSSEIINHIFQPNKMKSNVMEFAMEELCSMVGVENTSSMYENPFSFMEQFMKKSDRPFKDFKDYLALNQKSMKFLQVNMLTDTYDAGSLEENISNIYRTRSNPSYAYEKKSDSWRKDLDSLNFLTSISLNRDTMDYMSSEVSKNISNSDNKLIRAMKLRSLTKDKMMDSDEISYNRVEFNSYYDKSKIKTMCWSNIDTLIVTKDRKPSMDIYIYSNNDMDLSDRNNRIFSLFNKDMFDYKEKGYRMTFMNRKVWSKNHNVYYNKSNMMFKTEVKKNATKWVLNLVVSASRFKSFKDNDTIMATFKILTDSYTVDDTVLKDCYIVDAFDDEIQIKDLIDDIPDLITLDKILLKNSLLYELKLTEKQTRFNRAHKEIEDKYSVTLINEAFGMESMKLNLMSLIPSLVVTDSNFVMESTNEDTDQLEIGLNATKSVMESFLDSLARDDNNSDEYVETKLSEKNSIIKLVDYLVTESMSMTIQVNKREMNEYWTLFSKDKERQKTFHNMLLWQIRNAFDFDISNVMSLILYNCIVKNYMTTVNIKPLEDLKWHGPEIRNSVKESSIFVKRKRDMTDMFNEANIFE